MKKATKPPPPLSKTGSQSISLRLQRSKVAELDEIADRKGTPRSSLIQLAVAEYLEREMKK